MAPAYRDAVVRILTCFVLVGSLGACTDESSDDVDEVGSTAATPTLAFPTWHRETSEICSAAHEEVEALEQSLPDQPSVEQMMVVIRGTQAVGERQRASVAELGAPEARSDDAEDLISAMDEQLAVIGDIVEAGESGSASQLQAALRAPEVASTQAHLDAVAERLNLPDCGTGGDGGPPTTTAG